MNFTWEQTSCGILHEWEPVPCDNESTQNLFERTRLSDEELCTEWTMDELTLSEVNELPDSAFVDTLGSIYETSPWVAERALTERPFDSPDELRETMKDVVENATDEEQLALLRAHPNLGEQTEMTDASEKEQASAGLDQLTPEQYETFQRLNERYEEKFEFPFIMAVKNESPDTIQQAMEERIEHSVSVEFETALREVHEIARFRIDELLTA